MNTLSKPLAKQVPVTEFNPIPILHIIKSLGRGGAETLLPETLTLHNKEKYQFHYIYFLPWKYQMVSEIEKAGGTVTCFSAKNNLKILQQIFKIVTYIRQHQIKLIHCHLPWAGIVGRIVGKLTGVPVIYTEHNTWERYHRITYYLNRLSFASQHKVIAVSKEVANSINTYYRKKEPSIEVVLNGINTEKFSKEIAVEKDIRTEWNIPVDAIVIGVTCVFRVQKRLTTWLEIAKKLHDQYPLIHFIIVGDGVLRKEIFEKASSLNTSAFVHFAGLQSEVRPYLKAMDIFMMTSEFEGLPIALLEAMSMECMPACTCAGGIAEVIENNVNGVLAPVAEPQLLVDSLIPYLQDPFKIKMMGKAARATVINHFSLQKMVLELENIYDPLLNIKS